ncbi:hypothetical protein JAAARDRAFT_183956 [Jaapia argillacea MUCL 33604]|uniref:Peptidase M43 pregnancy-associated plasma-A domain-containing protein n=1 Tax=Jaapia argillacea MUCL 33604 TaxID=933084 RepID=A0A067PQU9_9AGAM|nr:hypothetical protein JAAARDRAFT_183956 [Jaapia argillacea MUCL 33604]
MILSQILGVFLAASPFAQLFASAFPAAPKPGVCGTYISPADILIAEAHFQEHLVQPPVNANAAIPSISVCWHIIYEDESVNGGYVSDAAIADQISVLNELYSQSGLSFATASVDRWNAPEFFSITEGSAEALAMKSATAMGNEDTLNIWTVGDLGGGIKGGFSTFPSQYTNDPISDGVVVLFSTLPGGPFAGANSGKNVVHEVGHWCGLYHTFQGGCTPPGDYVDDTPAEANPAPGGCPVIDSCPNDPGLDPVQNYMDYSSEECKTEFTTGQMSRMQDQLRTYRGISV